MLPVRFPEGTGEQFANLTGASATLGVVSLIALTVDRGSAVAAREPSAGGDLPHGSGGLRARRRPRVVTTLGLIVLVGCAAGRDRGSSRPSGSRPASRSPSAIARISAGAAAAMEFRPVPARVRGYSRPGIDRVARPISPAALGDDAAAGSCSRSRAGSYSPSTSGRATLLCGTIGVAWSGSSCSCGWPSGLFRVRRRAVRGGRTRSSRGRVEITPWEPVRSKARAHAGDAILSARPHEPSHHREDQPACAPA